MTEAYQAKMRFEPGRAWGWVLASGILSTLLGVIVLASSGVDKVWLLAIWIGLSFLLTGIQRLVLAAAQEENRGWAVASGVILLILALVTFVWPGETLYVVAWLAGLAAVIGGLLDVIAAIVGRTRNRGMVALRGVLALGIGAAILIWTPEAVWLIAVLFGAFLLVQGIFTVFAAFALRAVAHELEEEYGVSGGVVTVTTAQDEAGNVVQAVDVEPIPSESQAGTPPPQSVDATGDSAADRPADRPAD